MRNNRKNGRRYTDKQKTLMRWLAYRGISDKHIALTFGCSISTARRARLSEDYDTADLYYGGKFAPTPEEVRGAMRLTPIIFNRSGDEPLAIAA